MQKRDKELQKVVKQSKKGKVLYNIPNTQLTSSVFIDCAQVAFDAADEDYESEKPNDPPEIGYFTALVCY